jgi:hypothetical protein
MLQHPPPNFSANVVDILSPMYLQNLVINSNDASNLNALQIQKYGKYFISKVYCKK